MQYLKHILYGIIIGQWILNLRERLWPREVPGRYVVVGMHSMRDEFILVGKYDKYEIAKRICDETEEWSDCYIGLLYDTFDPADRAEVESKKFSAIDPRDVDAIERARHCV